MVTTYDPHCYQLAEHFLADDDVSKLAPAEIEQRLHDLACAIKQAVEDWRDEDAALAAEQADKDAELKSLRGLSDVEREKL